MSRTGNEWKNNSGKPRRLGALRTSGPPALRTISSNVLTVIAGYGELALSELAPSHPARPGGVEQANHAVGSRACSRADDDS